MLILLAICFPIIAGICVSVKKFPDERARDKCYAVISVVSLAIGILAMLLGKPVTIAEFSENVTLSFGFDNLGRYFLAAALIMYSLVAFYAFEYMKMEERPNVFFAFFYASYGAVFAVCASSNLVTMYLCFEMATLTTVPLVLHEGNKEATAAGLKYLFYSIAGALMGLFGVFFVYYYGSAGRTFTEGGYIDRAALSGHEGLLLAAVFVAILGFGTKAGMYPMHGWLPTAHPVAPAPASALLSGNIAKAGVIAVIRIVYYSVGVDFIKGTWVQYAWMILAMCTVFMGSMMAFMEKNLKKRLAFSTVSQISYIMLALSLLSPEGFRGGLLHVMGHASAKGCLFLVAGIFIYKLHKRNVADLVGVGKQMPVTLWCFLISALSLVGIPPLAGFLSKWVIAQAAVGDGMGVLAFLPPIVLLVSALLTAGYLLPIAFRGFFPGEDYTGSTENMEPSALMTVPLILFCACSFIMGIFGVNILAAIGF
ncbi:MAG: proton-conducting membrane transporter [Lachnospiraceae bacterium]|nr:proton-conducting membrane transporter [Lachnospiraceae bacterium]